MTKLGQVLINGAAPKSGGAFVESKRLTPIRLFLVNGVTSQMATSLYVSLDGVNPLQDVSIPRTPEPEVAAARSGDQNDRDLLPGRPRCKCGAGLLVAARFLGMAGPALRVLHLVVFTRIGLAPFPVEEVWTMPNGRLCGTSGKGHEERES